MSSQAEVHSIDALKDLRTALALYGEDTLAAIGAVEAEVRRTVNWLQQDRPGYWQDQIKRRRELVAQAKAEVFRRKLQKTPDYTPAKSEQMENLRKAEASLQDAEKKLTMVRKWQPMLQQAVFEYHASVQRIKDLAASDVPRALNLLGRIIDSLEAYLRVAPPSGLGLAGESMSTPAEFESIATRALDDDQPAGEIVSHADLAEAEEPVPSADEPESPDETLRCMMEVAETGGPEGKSLSTPDVEEGLRPGRSG